MWSWLKELFKNEGYLDWQDFTSRIDDMEIAEFKKKVQDENKDKFEI